MRITLNENEIKDALVQYVSGHGVDVTGRRVEVSLTAGRGPNGHSADIDILSAVDIVIPPGPIARPVFAPEQLKPVSEAKPSLIDEVAAMDIAEEVAPKSIFGN